MKIIFAKFIPNSVIATLSRLIQNTYLKKIAGYSLGPKENIALGVHVYRKLGKYPARCCGTTNELTVQIF